MKTKKIVNFQVLLEFICYVAFAVLIFYLAYTGKYQSYVTPKMVPYFYFTAVVMVIWALATLFRLFQPQHRLRTAHCFVLAIPIMLLLLPHTPVSNSNLSTDYLSGNTVSSNDRKSAPIQTAVPDMQANAPESVNQLQGLDTQNKIITVSNDDFVLWLAEIYENMQKYNGYTVIMTGYVFKDPKMMKPNEFVPARLMMSCCVADLAPVGLLCKYDKASELKADSWVTVEGALFIGKNKYGNQEIDDPQIAVTKITPAQAVDGYVFP